MDRFHSFHSLESLCLWHYIKKNDLLSRRRIDPEPGQDALPLFLVRDDLLDLLLVELDDGGEDLGEGHGLLAEHVLEEDVPEVLELGRLLQRVAGDPRVRIVIRGGVVVGGHGECGRGCLHLLEVFHLWEQCGTLGLSRDIPDTKS